MKVNYKQKYNSNYKLFMDRKFNLKNKEKQIYDFWNKNKLFQPKLIKNNKKNFSIIMPPPNVTGNLHIGHAFQQTIMDIIARYNRILGKNVLWIMGTDHAGIATQILVENYIKKTSGKIKITKKKLNKELWKWKTKYENNINKQTKLLGSSVDWTKTHFSLDKNFSYSVKKAFILLFNKKLIYKDKRIIHWDTKIKTVISDLEINKIKKKQIKYYIILKILNKNEKIIVPTTKPENILGITALGINIKNKKYQKFIKKYAINPINKNLIPIIGIKDKNKNKCIKIVPGHSFKDFKRSKKYKLNIINIFTLKGLIKKISDIYNYKKKKIITNLNLNNKNLNLYNLSIKESRKKIIQILNKKKKIIKIKTIKKTLFYSNKSNSITIPVIKNQWYLKTKKLSKKALNIIKKKKIKLIPKKYKKLFFYWMNNVKDWCISRQINWGHKIPIWYCKKNKEKIYVGYNIYEIKRKYNINTNKLVRDKNVLDTWFSSSLWSFTSLGWPKKTIEFNLFHPINIVVSGYDIIFFWISRMIMMTLCLIKIKNKSQIPFKKIFITGLIRDEKGNKMSKSLGNVINPIDIIKGISLDKLIKNRTKNLIKDNKISVKKIIKNTKKYFPYGIKSYGIDTLRFALSSISTSNITINFNMVKLNYSYNYCNKLWNTCRYMINIFKKKKYLYIKNIKIKKKKINITEYWILNSLNKFIINYQNNIKKFRFDNLCKEISNFLKNKFCDWYLELFKIYINFQKKEKYSINIALYILNIILLLSHPITPFITEYLWQKIKKYYIKNENNLSIIKEKINIKRKINFNNIYKITTFKIIKRIITFVRNIKNKYKIKKEISLIMFNINLIKKEYLIKNKYFLKIININKIFFLSKKYINQKIKINYSIPEKIYPKYNIYISYRLI